MSVYLWAVLFEIRSFQNCCVVGHVSILVVLVGYRQFSDLVSTTSSGVVTRYYRHSSKQEGILL
jgi:hypothetical protein